MRFGRMVMAGAASMLLLAAPAQAQLQSQGSPGGAPGAGGSSVAGDQPDLMTIDDLQFKVVRLVKDGEGGVRFLMQVTDLQDEGRQVVLVSPAATMLDDMGNRWAATSSTGIRICSLHKPWDERPAWCGPGQRSGEDLVRLAPKVPQMTVIDFEPMEGGVIQETLEMATQATFNARLLVAGGDNDIRYVDVVVPAIKLPK